MSSSYYHHTSEENAKKILKSGVIRQSEKSKSKGDAVYGDGTYLTKMGPSLPREDVAKNNYDGTTKFYKSQVEAGKTEVAFEVKLPQDKVEDKSEDGRDVHVYRGDIKITKSDKIHVRRRDKVETYQIK